MIARVGTTQHPLNQLSYLEIWWNNGLSLHKPQGRTPRDHLCSGIRRTLSVTRASRQKMSWTRSWGFLTVALRSVSIGISTFSHRDENSHPFSALKYNTESMPLPAINQSTDARENPAPYDSTKRVAALVFYEDTPCGRITSFSSNIETTYCWLSVSTYPPFIACHSDCHAYGSPILTGGGPFDQCKMLSMPLTMWAYKHFPAARKISYRLWRLNPHILSTNDNRTISMEIETIPKQDDYHR